MSGQQAWRELIQDWLLVSMVEENMTQASVAAASGLSQAQISKYCMGKDLPSDENLAALERALGRPAPRMVFVMPDTVAPGVREPAPAPTPARELLLEIFDALGERGRADLLGAARAFRLLEPRQPST